MILHPGTGKPVRTTANIESRAEWLEQFLASRKIDIDSKSELGRSLAEAREMVRLTRVAELIDRDRARTLLRSAMGLSYLVGLLEQATKQAQFAGIEALLPVVCQGDPIMTRASGHSQARSLSFELEIGCLFLLAGYAVCSKEPDLELEDRGTRWAVACKMIYGSHEVTLCDRVEDGIAQTLNAPPDYCKIVVLGLVDRMDHDSLLPISSSFNFGPFDSAGAQETMVARARNLVRVIQSNSTERFLHGRSDPRFRGLITVVHSVAGLSELVSLESNISLLPRAEWFGHGTIGPEAEMLNRLDRALTRAGS